MDKDPLQFDMSMNKRWINYDQNRLNLTFKSVEQDGVKYYIADGEEFKFLIHVIDVTKRIVKSHPGSTAQELEQIKYLQENLGSNPRLFVNSNLGNTTISGSTISDKAMFTYGDALRGTGDIILGFNEDKLSNVYHYSYDDAGVMRGQIVTKTDDSIYELANEPKYRNHYDEVVISRQGRLPNYIVSPFPPGDPRNENNIKWAKEYNIPIVYVNTKKYLEKYHYEIMNLLAPLSKGIIPSPTAVMEARSLYAAINAIGKIDTNIIKGDLDTLIYQTLMNNINKENADKYFQIMDNAYGKLVEATQKANSTDKIFDAFILHFNLNTECPHLSRNEMVSIIMRELSHARNKNEAVIEEPIIKLLKTIDDKVKNKQGMVIECNGLPVYNREIPNGLSSSSIDNYYVQYRREIAKYFMVLNKGLIPSKNDISKMLLLYSAIDKTNSNIRVDSLYYNRDSLESLILKAVDINPSKENADKALNLLDMNDLDKSSIYQKLVEASGKLDANNWIFDAVIRHYHLMEKYPTLSKDEIVSVLMKSAITPRNYAPTKFNTLNYELEELNRVANNKKDKIECNAIPIIDKETASILPVSNRNNYCEYYLQNIKILLESLKNGIIPSKEDITNGLLYYKGINNISTDKDINEIYTSMNGLGNIILKAVDLNPTMENAQKALDLLDIPGIHKSSIYRTMIKAINSGNSNHWIFDAVIRHYKIQEKYAMLTKDEIVNVIMKTVSTPRNQPITDENVLTEELNALDKYVEYKKQQANINNQSDFSR